MKSRSFSTAKGGAKVPTKFFCSIEIDAVLHADAGIVLRQHGGRNADVADAAMRRRRDEADRIEHGAAADGDHVGMAVDAMLVELALHRLDEMQLDLDLLAARHRQSGRRPASYARACRCRIGADFSWQCRARRRGCPRRRRRCIDAAGRLPAGSSDIDEHRVLGVEERGRENDREFVSRRRISAGARRPAEAPRGRRLIVSRVQAYLGASSISASGVLFDRSSPVRPDGSAI